MRSDHGLPPWVLSSSFFLSFFSICFSTELAPHFNSLPCVALAATYQIPNLETQPVFFHEGKRNTIADAERTPSSTASIQFLLTMLRHRVAKIELVCVCSDKVNFLYDILPAVIGFLPFNVEISYFESNVLGVTFVMWQEQWKKWQQKEKKVSKNLNHPCSVLNTSDKILC